MGGSGTNEELLNKIIELEQVPVEVQAVEHTNLIDGDQLCDLLKDLKLGVRTEMVEQVNVEPGWFNDL